MKNWEVSVQPLFRFRTKEETKDLARTVRKTGLVLGGLALLPVIAFAVLYMTLVGVIVAAWVLHVLGIG